MCEARDNFAPSQEKDRIPWGVWWHARCGEKNMVVCIDELRYAVISEFWDLEVC